MADAQMVVRASPGGVTEVLGGMGILRLLRVWPDRAAGDRAVAVADAPPHLDVDRRASALALAEILSDWRAAERRLDQLVMDGLDWTEAEAEVASLRAAHQRLFAELKRSL